MEEEECEEDETAVNNRLVCGETNLLNDDEVKRSRIPSTGMPMKSMEEELAEFSEREGEHHIFGVENLEFLVLRDAEYAPDPFYLSGGIKQPNLSASMRAILLDWMMEVSEEFGLKRETFHIAVNLIDRYLSVQLSVKKREFQLIGVTCLYIAAKLEVIRQAGRHTSSLNPIALLIIMRVACSQEVLPPSIEDFVSSTNNGYSPQEINLKEINVLQVASKQDSKWLL